MSKKYTAEYFIQKFQAIPPGRWTTRRYFDDRHLRHCALGHCGCTGVIDTKESLALGSLFRLGGLPNVASVNDGLICASLDFKQKTPRGRILAALRHLQNGTVPRKLA